MVVQNTRSEALVPSPPRRVFFRLVLHKAFALQFFRATTFAGIAQLVEHLICNQEVRGSNPCVGTTSTIHMTPVVGMQLK